ncbi:hypothetical protein CCACVL1_11336 [Corchorus capsularis]|uniref:Uncharacterized protein n=1 Tax=Corchorus capsularis TaxID=210143 RepID=A0A1R3ILW7_COCAP|nr:hypothetical protein CCACVL1_11336 [Corchorus capsularis]
MACLAFIVQQNFEKFAPNQILVVAIAIAIATCGERVMEEMIVWVDDNKGERAATVAGVRRNHCTEDH